MAAKKLQRKKSKKERKSVIKLIVKSNNLVEARYMMDIWESRIFFMVLSMIREDDNEEQVYRIWYGDVKRKFDLKSNTSYKDLREAALRLTQKTVYLDWTTEDDFDRLTSTHLFSWSDVLKPGQEHKAGFEQQQYADFQLGEKIKPHLLAIKQRVLSKQKITSATFEELGIVGYTSYDMWNIKRLKPYGARIYEILKKYESTGFWIVSVANLKSMFLIEDEYPKFPNFFQKVIKKSVADINKNTDIFVREIEKIKEGRKVSRLKFLFRSKSKEEIALIKSGPTRKKKQVQPTLFELEPPTSPKETDADLLYNQFEEVVVKSFGVTPSVFIKMLTSGKYKKEAIEQAIAVTRSAKFKQEITKNIAGFFIKALQEGFTNETIERKKKEQNRENQKEAIEKEFAQKKLDKVKELLESNDDVQNKTLTYLKNNPSPKLTALLEKLNLSLLNVTVQDFRADKDLRPFFINGIFHEFATYFKSIDEEYKRKISAFS